MSYSNPQFPSPYGSPYGQSPQPKGSGGGSTLLWIAITVLGGGALLTCVCCGGGAFMFTRAPTISASAKQPFNVAAVPLPAFPDRGLPLPMEIEPDVQLFRAQLGPAGAVPATPGHGGSIWVYLPKGNHAPGSLPCVLITGAGTTLLHGLEWGDLNLDGGSEEHLPYVDAGFAVVAYELDGTLDEFGEDEKAMQRAYDAFRASQAGLVNARNALEFTLAKVPEVDPKRIYAAGHSSAGTAALLFAEHEPRLAGCIAFAPCIDLMERFGPMGVRGLSMLFPSLADFLVQSSPKTHEARLNCPVFLFHADDDSNVPCADSRACEQRLKAAGKKVTLVTVPQGDHYDAMIDEGIAKAIEWLKQQGGK